jgi:predicted ferric reductase
MVAIGYVVAGSLNCLKRFKKSKYTHLQYYRNNLAFLITFLVYFLVQLGLVILQINTYQNSIMAVRVARVGAILIDFNISLMILLVLRRFTTWIRNSFIGRNYLPIDQTIQFHKFIGCYIVILSLMHIIGQSVNLCNDLL